MSNLIESSNQPCEVGAIIMAIYREGKGGTERLGNLPRVTQPVSGGPRRSGSRGKALSVRPTVCLFLCVPGTRCPQGPSWSGRGGAGPSDGKGRLAVSWASAAPLSAVPRLGHPAHGPALSLSRSSLHPPFLSHTCQAQTSSWPSCERPTCTPPFPGVIP